MARNLLYISSKKIDMLQMDPTYRPSLMDDGSNGAGLLPFAGSDLVLSPSQWSGHVVGMAFFLW